ncbi:hypothetical protein PGIGA_G00080310 [Pangasianodon gigas]|uniref:Uncharacterized protein n=1 Tax=Pangasianodon gigas TaxID=30993 RepID=A0ACC5X9P5_PANGG|nr:hypothetical protein [Pangasianodon gigas]
MRQREKMRKLLRLTTTGKTVTQHLQKRYRFLQPMLPAPLLPLCISTFEKVPTFSLRLLGLLVRATAEHLPYHLSSLCTKPSIQSTGSSVGQISHNLVP